MKTTDRPSLAKKPASEKKTRKAKTAAELKADLEKAKKRVAELEQKAYAGELAELIKKQNIVSSINLIKANIKGVNLIMIITAVAKAAGLARVEITQKPPVKRKAKPAQ